jgi:hypothetical protein
VNVEQMSGRTRAFLAGHRLGIAIAGGGGPLLLVLLVLLIAALSAVVYVVLTLLLRWRRVDVPWWPPHGPVRIR